MKINTGRIAMVPSIRQKQLYLMTFQNNSDGKQSAQQLDDIYEEQFDDNNEMDIDIEKSIWEDKIQY